MSSSGIAASSPWRALGPAALLGSGLAKCRQCRTPAVWLVSWLHGAGCPGQDEPSVRTPHGADSPATVRLSGSGAVPPALVAGRPGEGVWVGGRPPAVPALPRRRALHRSEHSAQSTRRVGPALSRADVSAPRGAPRSRSVPVHPLCGRCGAGVRARDCRGHRAAGAEPCTTTCSSWWRSVTCGGATPWSADARIRSSCASAWTIRCCASGSGSYSPI